MIRPSSLKGQFRQALITVCHENEQGQIELLCGHANEDDDTGQKGRLEFLPCYIDKEIRHDVIAPHNEKIRRIDPGPVTIEVVDPPLVLSLWIQYWPLDLLSIWASQRRVNEEDLIFDLIYTVAGIHYWLSRIGIGAKTSSGYGKIDYDSAKVSLFAAKASPWKSLLEKQPCPVKELIATKYQKHLVNRFSLKWAEFQQSVEKTGL
jgi:CRISPR/Cas system CMR subunit Cmr6 (Cas7 group RAMP superfamily)